MRDVRENLLWLLAVIIGWILGFGTALLFIKVFIT